MIKKKKKKMQARGNSEPSPLHPGGRPHHPPLVSKENQGQYKNKVYVRGYNNQYLGMSWGQQPLLKDVLESILKCSLLGLRYQDINVITGLARWLSGSRCLSLSLTTQIQAPEPTWWKENWPPHDLHAYMHEYRHTYMKYTNKRNKYDHTILLVFRVRPYLTHTC